MGVGWGVSSAGLGDLGSVFPADLIEAVVDKTGCREQRTRVLPSSLMVVFGLVQALRCPEPYLEVLRYLGPDGGQGTVSADKAAVFRARLRIGAAPFAELLAQVGVQAGPSTPGAFYRGLRLMAMDGTTIAVADSPGNREVFGLAPHRSDRTRSAFPLARVLALIESGTHVVIDAAVAGCAVTEKELVPQLARSLRPGMLLLADAGLPSVALAAAAVAAGADVLFRVPSTWGLAPIRVLTDGSWLAEVASGKKIPAALAQRMTVRVLHYRLDDPGRDPDIDYRLVTTLLDPEQGPAPELSALYHERWEAEGTLAEVKTAQMGREHVIASKHPVLAEQEILAHLAVHAGIRALMHHAAMAYDPPIDPDRLSFTTALRAVRRSQTLRPGIFPPHQPAAASSDPAAAHRGQPTPQTTHRPPA